MDIRHYLEVLRWPSLVIQGEVAIPAECPTCLAAADFRVDTERRALLGNNSYATTVPYCRKCGAYVTGYNAYHDRIGFLGASPAGGLALGFIGGQRMFGWGSPWLWLTTAGGLVLALVVMWVLRRMLLRPLRHDGLPQHPTAYYTGEAFIGMKDSGSQFRAWRPEWLLRLAEANVGHVEPKSLEALRRVPAKASARAAAPSRGR
jgi:hypothetical protein